MDIIIVSIIIAAAVLYSGNIFFKKFKAVRSGKNGCGDCSCGAEGTCNVCPLERIEGGR